MWVGVGVITCEVVAITFTCKLQLLHVKWKLQYFKYKLLY